MAYLPFYLKLRKNVTMAETVNSMYYIAVNHYQCLYGISVVKYIQPLRKKEEVHTWEKKMTLC